MIVFWRCLSGRQQRNTYNESLLYSRDGKDGCIFELRNTNDLLNGLIRLEVDRGRR
jgi:hypothetical protein